MEVAGRRSRCRVGRSRPSARSALRRSRVLLALRFLALPLHARLLVVLATAGLGEDATLLDLLVEAAQGALERLVLTHSDFSQSVFTSSGLSLASCVPARGRPARMLSRAACRQSRRSIDERRRRVKRASAPRTIGR